MNTPVKSILKEIRNFYRVYVSKNSPIKRHPRLTVLMYHRVITENEMRGRYVQPGMYVTPGTLRKNIQVLKKYYKIIRMSEWVELVENKKPIDEQYCVLTFDDGWADNYNNAFDILKSENVPITLYLASDYVGTNRQFWPERLASILTIIYAQTHTSTDLQRYFKTLFEVDVDFSLQKGDRVAELDRVITEMKRYPDSLIEDKIEKMISKYGLTDDGYDPAIVNWKQVKEMVDSGLVEIGSHTKNHRRLASLTDKLELFDEVFESKKKIEKKIGFPVELFSFPNGDVSDESKKLVNKHYKTACTTRRGVNEVNDSLFDIKRISIHDDVASNSLRLLARLSCQ